MTSCSHSAAVISRNAGWSTVMWLPRSSGSRGVDEFNARRGEPRVVEFDGERGQQP